VIAFFYLQIQYRYLLLSAFPAKRKSTKINQLPGLEYSRNAKISSIILPRIRSNVTAEKKMFGQKFVSRLIVSSVVISLVIFIFHAQSVAVFNLSFRAICDKGTTGVALFRNALGSQDPSCTAFSSL